MSTASFVVASLLTLSGPFFPASLVVPRPTADTRRCVIGALATQSDCALIGEQWVITTASAVASARPVGGRLHVRIGDRKFTVDQLIYHPKWAGGLRYDVTLVKLAGRVPSFPLLPPPGEFPVNIDRVVQHAVPQREWIARTTGVSSLWAAGASAVAETRESGFLTRVRSLVGWPGRASND